MPAMRSLAPLALAGLLLAGCVTALGQGQAALRTGRYDEAVTAFRRALADEPDRVDARFGLGVALYQTGDFDGAVEALRAVAGSAPRNTDARLFLALAHLQRGEDAAARDQLEAFGSLEPHPRLAAQAARAVEVLRLASLPDVVRRFVAASLEDEARWEREVREIRLLPHASLEPTWFMYGDRFGWYPYGWYPYRSPVLHAP